MSIIELLLKEIEQEAQNTRAMLSRVPDDKYDWQPHPKSMTIQRLTNHIAELPAWFTMAFDTEELDFAANPYEATHVNNTKELLELFEESVAKGTASLQTVTEEELNKKWTLRSGEHIINVFNKAEVVRVSLCQITHHRAQLGVYLRLLNIPIPGSYGPSADEMNFN